MAQSLRKLLLFILLTLSFVLYEKQAQAAFISPDDWNDLSTWTASYTARTFTDPDPNYDTYVTSMDSTYVTYATLPSSSASLSTPGYNPFIFMTSIQKDVFFDGKGTLQFGLDFRTSDDVKGTDYSEEVHDFLTLSFMSSDGLYYSLPVGNPTNFLNTISWDVSDLFGMNGTLYFDLYDQDDAKLTTATISSLAFTPASINPVPEPSTLALLLGGLAIFGTKAASRRKKR